MNRECLACGIYKIKLDDKQKRIDELQDLVEWMKHQLSEQAWHWTEVVTGLNLQLKHERKRNEREDSVRVYENPRVDPRVREGETDYVAGELWGKGQRS